MVVLVDKLGGGYVGSSRGLCWVAEGGGALDNGVNGVTWGAGGEWFDRCLHYVSPSSSPEHHRE